MRVSIIREDNCVVVNGRPATVDCSDLPSYVRVIQWTGTEGHIELHKDANGAQPGNIEIAKFDPYAIYVDRWRLKDAENAAIIPKRFLEEKEGQVKLKEEQRRLAEEHKVLQEKALEETQRQTAAVEQERREIDQRIAVVEKQNAELQTRLKKAEGRLKELDDANN